MRGCGRQGEEDGDQGWFQRRRKSRGGERPDGKRNGNSRRQNDAGGWRDSQSDGGEMRGKTKHKTSNTKPQNSRICCVGVGVWSLEFLWCLMFGFWCFALTGICGDTNVLPNAQPIDLPTALRLAGAQNLDVQIAREKLREAKANHVSAVSEFFPWVSPGVAYRQHDDKIQDVQGNIIDVHKYSYAPGATVGVQLDLGDALFKALAAKQLARAADHALEAQRQESVYGAARGYFELSFAQAAVDVANEAVRIASDYETQLDHAVDTGVAFKGDLLRARVEAERNRLTLRQAQEQQRVVAARLAQALRLHPGGEIVRHDL